MTIGASLLNSIPTNLKTQAPPPVASVMVGDVEDVQNSTPKISPEEIKPKNFIQKFIERFKEKMVEKRIAKLEKIPPSQRTEADRSEILANQTAAQGLNCMV